MVVNPFACINDGMLDVMWVHDEAWMGLLGVAGLLDKAKKSGSTHVYDESCTFMRGKQIKMTYVGQRDKKMPTNGWGEQLLGIDGEDLRFTNQLTFDCIPNNIEFFFDSKTYFKDHKSFTD